MQAAERIAELTPDLVLLDIQMPGASGLDVAASLGRPRPAVIFCTAFDQYAVDAFELSALDYLLKPVNRARLAAALDRVRAATAPSSGRDRAIEQLTQRERHGADALPRQARQPLPRRARRSEVVAFMFVDGVTHLLTTTEQLSMQPTLAVPRPPAGWRKLLPGVAKRDHPARRSEGSETLQRRHWRDSAGERPDDGRGAPPLAGVAQPARGVASSKL